jgi:hydroxyethylthiazole kinase-like uncharacterized protein yjeF
MANSKEPASRTPWTPAPASLTSLVSPPLFLGANIRAIDTAWAARHPEISLMARAGAAAAGRAAMLAGPPGPPVLVLAGPGNNGGDALVAARALRAAGYTVVVVSNSDGTRLPPDAHEAWAQWGAAGGRVEADIPAGEAYALVVDGLFGVGLAREVSGSAARWIDTANRFACPRLALDVPSGLDSDTGRVRGTAIRATATLTFLGLKPGLLTADGPDCCGELLLEALGVDADLCPATAGTVLTGLAPRHVLPARRKNSHKGDYGRVVVIGGAPGMVGAALIAGRAAIEFGAGSVTVGALDERVVVDFGEPRLMFANPESLLDTRPTVLAIGPGLGQTPRAHTLLAAALAAPCPLILDADALNLLANDRRLAEQVSSRHAPTLLTPHAGEAGRLLGIASGEIQANRIAAAQRLSEEFRAHVALKGAGTVIAHPDGRYAINTSGGPWLARAGSGDRLTGVVAALIGQGMRAENAIEAAVWLHGGQREISTSVS